MKELVENLKNHPVLYPKHVIQIRETISNRYPNASPLDRAKLFSTAIYRLLGQELHSLSPAIQEPVQTLLIQDAILKKNFSINAYQVLETCTTLDLSIEEEQMLMANWIYKISGYTPSKEDIGLLLSHLKEGASLSPPTNTIASTTISTPLHWWINKKLLASMVGCSSLIILLIVVTILPTRKETPIAIPITTPLAVIPPTPVPINHLKPELQYKTIDTNLLKQWLLSRNSLLAEDSYFNTIMEVAEEFWINPLLLFAITGQEQGFVPKSHPRALEIANNPFNVYGSWQDFNTDLTDTCRIAARTILNLSKDCPTEADPIWWLNQKYAEDPNWHVGVTKILNQLEKDVVP